ncbi:MAG TPA: nitrile hydratase accessory protein [Solirubrobacteraceae bacterium]|jgi:nitrile hydratase accessory protein|nr:nitrile hydratase accessory protein [Solirubrobacteraceae bacterium]
MSPEAGIDADIEGPVSPPRDNGEIVFAAPWERRAFGLVIALCRAGACEWESFRRRLVARIAQDESRPYWSSWAAALEDVLADVNALTRGETDARHLAFLARPHGHDHHH